MRSGEVQTPNGLVIGLWDEPKTKPAKEPKEPKEGKPKAKK